MQREYGLGRERALALASVCVDLRVTQIVNEAKGVHAVLRHDALAPSPVGLETRERTTLEVYRLARYQGTGRL